MNVIENSIRNEIHDLLCRFFLAFDQRDWDAMRATLAAEVFVDYASSGREQPTRMSRDDFVQRRKGVVDSLSKQHSFSNLLMTKEQGMVRGRCNYLILRFAAQPPSEGDDFFHSCGSYEFVFVNAQGRWFISSITQKALRSWGNASLHGGSKGSAMNRPAVQDGGEQCV